MLSLGSKAFFGVAAAALAAAVVVGIITNDLAAVTILAGASGVAAWFGAAAVAATGTGESRSGTALVGTQSPLVGRAPQSSAGPFIVALAGGTAVLGAALGPVAWISAAVVGAMGLVAWYSRAWREHPRFHAALGPRVSDRFSLPIGLPVAVLGLIAIIVIATSRILLSVTPTSAWVIALILAVVIVIAGIVAAIRPVIDRRLVYALGAVATAAVLALGIVGLVRGEREFEHHGAEAAAGHEASEEGKTGKLAAGAEAAEPAAEGAASDDEATSEEATTDEATTDEAAPETTQA